MVQASYTVLIIFTTTVYGALLFVKTQKSFPIVSVLLLNKLNESSYGKSISQNNSWSKLATPRFENQNILYKKEIIKNEHAPEALTT
jgi:hypothetical protein